MDTLLQCKDCDWSGLEKDCTKGYRGIVGEWDAEPYIMCPKCGSENLIELSGRGAALELCPV